MTTKPTVLLLDDNLLICFEIAQKLEEKGMSVMGPFNKTSDAMRSLKVKEPDVAILDINMGNGTTSIPLADALLKQKLPFAFLTGYGSADVVPSRFDKIIKMKKPTHPNNVLSVVNSLLSQSE